MKKSTKEITWLKLDNAALIYPSTLSRKYACMFRLTVTLNEDINKVILSNALNNIMNRFPTFNFELKQGFFWCYFNRINNHPITYEDYNNPMLRINFDKNNKYMFRIRTYKNRIAIELFHALCDGYSALSFLLTLTCEYLKLMYNIKPKYTDLVLNPKEKTNIEEIEDAFLKVASSKGSLVHENKAYHIKGTKIEANLINIITGVIDINSIKKEAKKYDCTITEYITSLLILSIQELRKNDKIKSKHEIKISIPVNLRKIYNIKTQRNFSSYVNVSVDNKKEYTLKEIIKIVKDELKTMLNEKSINDKISANVKLMKNPFIRRVPMFIKKHIMSFIESKMGDGYITTTLSNLGNIEIPDVMKKYITDMNFILGNSRGKSYSVTSIGYNNKLYITFSKNIKESEFERLFFTRLVKLGINVLIESNR